VRLKRKLLVLTPYLSQISCYKQDFSQALLNENRMIATSTTNGVHEECEKRTTNAVRLQVYSGLRLKYLHLMQIICEDKKQQN